MVSSFACYGTSIAAVDGLLARLSCDRIPQTLISQFFPAQIQSVRAQGGIAMPAALIEGVITAVLDDYAAA